MQLLDIIYKLLETETYEERIKLCFVLGELSLSRLCDRPQQCRLQLTFQLPWSVTMRNCNSRQRRKGVQRSC